MKKKFIAPILFLSLISVGTNAQKYDKQKMYDLLSQKKYTEAKAELDKILANPEEASKPEMLTLKTRIYGDILSDPALLQKYPDAIDQAYASFEAFTKAVPDTAKQRTILMDSYIAGINGLNALYVSQFNGALTDFNAQKYESAFQSFKISSVVGTYFRQNGYFPGQSRESIDTLGTLYAGYAAQNLVKDKPAYKDSALAYYKIIADRQIGTKEAENAYKILASEYYDKKDKDNLVKILDFAKVKYPASKEYWAQYESELLTMGATPDQLIDKYNAASNLSEEELKTYASSFGDYARKATDAGLKSKLQDAEVSAYRKLTDMDATNALYPYNAGILTNRNFDDLESQFRAAAGTTPALKAKRAEIETQQQAVSDTLIDYFTKSYTILKAKTDKSKQEESVLKGSVAQLANLYDWKRGKARGHDTTAYDKYDKLFNQFDAEYNALNKK